MTKTKLALTLLGVSLTIGGAYGGTRLEENDPGITYKGTWKRTADAQASDGFYMVSSTVGDTVTFQIPGDNFILYRRMATDGGAIGLSVDGTYLERVYCLFAETREQVPAVIENLGPGPHTITLTVAINYFTGSGGNVYIDAIEFPNQYVPSAAQQMELTAVNQNRTASGLPTVSLEASLDLAAKAYADYLANLMATSNQINHEETQGQPFYTGDGPTERGWYSGTENLLSEVASPYADPILSLGSWMATVYHREPFMAYNNSYFGFGNTTAGQQGYAVADFGETSAAPQSRILATWPGNNQTNVPLAFQGESPDPFAGVASRPQGYPISVHIAQPATVAKGTDNVPASATLTANNQPVPVYYLDRNNDTQNSEMQQVVSNDDYYMIPMQPLSPGTTYTATIAGTDFMGHQFTQSWKFTTMTNSSISSVFAFKQNDGTYAFSWATAGPVATSYVQYGPTTAYGSKMAGTGFNANQFYADIGTQASGTYHYQITATDASGVTSTSPDATFTIIANGTISNIITPAAYYFKTDFATQGNWSGVYGSDGYNVIGDTSNIPAYVTVTPSGNTPYTWQQSTTDVRALQKASAKTDRVAACWYSTTAMTVDLNITDGNTHLVAFYLEDWDGYDGGRSQRVEILDSAGNILDSRPVSGFGNGQYMIWNLAGHVVARFTNTNPQSNSLVTGIFFGPPGNAPAPPTVLSGNYKLIPQNAASSLCLDVYGAGTSPGTNMDAWTCTGGSNQSFNFVAQGNGIYQIQPSYSTGLCLDVYGGGTSAPGTNVDAWTCNGGSNQQWALISDGGNIYELAPQNAPGLRLDVFGGGTSNGTQIDVWTANGGSNQKWAITK